MPAALEYAEAAAVPYGAMEALRFLRKGGVGAGAFTNEAGIHVDGLLKDPANYQGFDPALVGRSHRLVLGKHSGQRAVQAIMRGLGCELDADSARCMLEAVRSFVVREKRPPSDDELKRMWLALGAGESLVPNH